MSQTPRDIRSEIDPFVANASEKTTESTSLHPDDQKVVVRQEPWLLLQEALEGGFYQIGAGISKVKQ